MKTVKTTVGAIIPGKEGRILLALRDHDPFTGFWCIPGGHIDFGEHPDEAMKREIREETGLSVVSFRFFNYYSEFYREIDWHAVALIYLAQTEGILSPQSGEVRELKWVLPEEALALPLAFNHKEMIRDYFFALKGGERLTSLTSG